jgi:tRNA A-37 threonylcarbamoyl transferase component Bud32
MAFVCINPRHEPLLRRHGLTSAEQFLGLPGVIISGHPDRNVARVTLGSGPEARTAFLKREHRVRWRVRLANAWCGHGWFSRSLREARTLEQLRQAGVGCAEWMAVGEDDQQRAFLLIEGMAGCEDLQQFLRERRLARAERTRLARNLGQAIARLHESGFDQPDLYSKHVLVDPGSMAIRFIDWQRSRHWPRLSWQRRCRDLAALDATLARELATARERLLCWRSYLAGTTDGHLLRGRRRIELARGIRRMAERLLRRRHIRGVRHCPQALGTQGIVWLDGEALCVTQEYWAALGGRTPDWLTLVSEAGTWTGRSEGTVVNLPGGRAGLLVASRYHRPLQWLWSAIRGRPWMAPEVRQAGRLFRMERHGLDAPRLLAFGQRRPRPWRAEAFLLTELQATCTRSHG